MSPFLRLFRVEPAFRSTVGILIPATVAGAILFALVVPPVPRGDDGPSAMAAFFSFMYPLAWGALHRDALRDRASLWQLSLPVSSRTLWLVRTAALLLAGLVPVVLGPWLLELLVTGPSAGGSLLVGHLALGMAAGVVILRSIDADEAVVSIRALVAGGTVAIGSLGLTYSSFRLAGMIGIGSLAAALAWRAIRRLPPSLLVTLDPPAAFRTPSRFEWPSHARLLTLAALTRILIPGWLAGSYVALYLLMAYLASAGGIGLVLTSTTLMFASTGFALPILRRVGRLEHLPVSRRVLFRWIAAPAGLLVVLTCAQWIEAAGQSAAQSPLAPIAAVPLMVGFLAIVWLLSMWLLLSEFRAAIEGRRIGFARLGGLGLVLAAASLVTEAGPGLSARVVAAIVSMASWSDNHLPVAMVAAAIVATVSYWLAEREFVRLELPG